MSAVSLRSCVCDYASSECNCFMYASLCSAFSVEPSRKHATLSANSRFAQRLTTTTQRQHDDDRVSVSRQMFCLALILMKLYQANTLLLLLLFPGKASVSTGRDGGLSLRCAICIDDRQNTTFQTSLIRRRHRRAHFTSSF
jgi:hypothetical protein